MKISPSIRVVWRQAAREAVLGKYEEIEPEHFCLALLKFSGFSAKDMQWPDDGQNADSLLLAEAALLAKAIKELGLNNRAPFRRKLRAHLGKGGYPHPDGGSHRSFASRRLFEKATEIAGICKRDLVNASDLWQAFLESPPESIKKMPEGVLFTGQPGAASRPRTFHDRQ